MTTPAIIKLIEEMLNPEWIMLISLFALLLQSMVQWGMYTIRIGVRCNTRFENLHHETHLLWEPAPFTVGAIEWDQNGYSSRSNTMQRKPESWSWDQCSLNGWLCAAQVVTNQLRSVCSKIENIDKSVGILASLNLAKPQRWLYSRELDLVICLMVHCSKLAPVDEIAAVSY